MPKLHVIEDNSKQCTQCSEWKDVSDYYSYPNGRLKSECKSCKSARDREYYKRTKEKAKSKFVENTYGISLEEVEQIRIAQNGKCASCGDKESGRGLFIDHDHKTGAVRGLLCQHCNTGLGMAKDSIRRLNLMIDYLRTHNSRI